ncbi:MAG: universal stress protein [Thermodesulfovibrionales bacterium]|nr:universal stress protein [Thermodesulfovibrionales bacterium]
MEFKKILFPTDFSEGAMRAMVYAFEMAKKFSAKVYMVHVVYDISTVSGLYVPHISVSEMYKELESGAMKELEKFGFAQRKDFKDVEYSVLRGVPYEEIVKFAHDKAVDLIVIGSHGRRGIDRVLFGSTAERVVRYAKCAVMTIRAD